MNKKFDVILLEEAFDFIGSLDEKTQDKVYYNLRKAEQSNDPKLFKKLLGDIWEFRTLFNKKQYRLFAFWDKRDNKNVLVVATHGIVKKTSKVPKGDIKKAEQIMKEYFESDL